MADKVMDAISKLAWRTHVYLLQAAEAVKSDLPFWANGLAKLAWEHAELFQSCSEDTCPTIPRGRTQELTLLGMDRRAAHGLNIEAMLTDDDLGDP